MTDQDCPQHISTNMQNSIDKQSNMRLDSRPCDVSHGDTVRRLFSWQLSQEKAFEKLSSALETPRLPCPVRLRLDEHATRWEINRGMLPDEICYGRVLGTENGMVGRQMLEGTVSLFLILS